jgi:hypothetical protein
VPSPQLSRDSAASNAIDEFRADNASLSSSNISWLACDGGHFASILLVDEHRSPCECFYGHRAVRSLELGEPLVDRTEVTLVWHVPRSLPPVPACEERYSTSPESIRGLDSIIFPPYRRTPTTPAMHSLEAP